MKFNSIFGLNNKSALLIFMSIITQLLPFIFSPFFSRIYSPLQFGEYSLLLSYSGIFLIFFSGKYELALLLPRYDIDIKNIFRLCLLILSLNFFLTNLVMAIYYFLSIRFHVEFENIFLIVPILTILLSIYQLMSYLILYLGYFKELSISRFLKSTITVLVTLLFGVYLKGINGLLYGAFLGQIVSIIYFIILLKRTKRFRKIFVFQKYSTFKNLIVKYINFPKFSMPADIINALVTQAPVFFITYYYTKTTLGYYGFVLAVIQVPLSIMSSAVLDVFKEMATKEFKLLNNCKKSFIKILKILFFLNIVPLLIILFFGPKIFSFLFGNKWIESGFYAKILIIMLVIKYIASPLSYTFTLLGKQKLDFYLHVIMLFILILTFSITILFKMNIYHFLTTISIVFSIIYLIYFLKSYEFAKNKI